MPTELRVTNDLNSKMDRILRFQSYLMWCLISPLVLLCQVFPSTETRTRVASRHDGPADTTRPERRHPGIGGPNSVSWRACPRT